MSLAPKRVERYSSNFVRWRKIDVTKGETSFMSLSLVVIKLSRKNGEGVLCTPPPRDAGQNLNNWRRGHDVALSDFSSQGFQFKVCIINTFGRTDQVILPPPASVPDSGAARSGTEKKGGHRGHVPTHPHRMSGAL